MNRILPVRISFHILCLPLLITSLVAPVHLAADELEFARGYLNHAPQNQELSATI